MGYQSNQKRKRYSGSSGSAESVLCLRPAIHGSFALGVAPHSEEWNSYEAWGIQPEHVVHLSVWSKDLSSFLGHPNQGGLSLFAEEQTGWALSPDLIADEWIDGLAPLPVNVKRTKAWSVGVQGLARKYQLPTLTPGLLHLAVEHMRASYHGVNVQEGVIAHYIEGPFKEADRNSRLRATVGMAYRVALADLAGMEVRKLVVGNGSASTIVEGKMLELMVNYGYRLAHLVNACWEAFVVDEQMPPFC